MVNFTANRIQFLETLKCLKTSLAKDRLKTGITNCELTATSNEATFALPGAIFSLPCIATGAVKVIFPFYSIFENFESGKQRPDGMNLYASKICQLSKNTRKLSQKSSNILKATSSWTLERIIFGFCNS